jgi:DNA-binding response OmpR family regulator
VAHLLLLTNTLAPSAEVLPALSLLSHRVHIVAAEPAALIDSPSADVVLVDARRELAAGRSLCRMLRTTGLSVPLLAILTEGGLAGLTAEWGVDDVVLETAGPAEVEARLRLAMGSVALPSGDDPTDGQITAGDLVIDENSYSARVGGRLLDLTYKEFELIKLLQEVWGYDYFGGTRTVDVHVRRLRAKLGLEHEVLIGTVRNVGYRFVPEPPPGSSQSLAEA